MERKRTFLFVILIISNCFVPGNSSSGKDDTWFGPWVKTGLKVVGTVVVGAAGIAAAPVVLAGVGVTSAGVAVGSLAAGVQSVVYGGATCGAFSVVQSVGAAGIGMATKIAIGSASNVIVSKAVDYYTAEDDE